jgi:hypothetical protein
VFVAGRSSVLGSLSANMVSGGFPLMDETRPWSVGSYIIKATSSSWWFSGNQEGRFQQAATHSLTRSVRILGVEFKRKFIHSTALTRSRTNTLNRHRTLAVISTVGHGSGPPTRHWLE